MAIIDLRLARWVHDGVDHVNDAILAAV